MVAKKIYVHFPNIIIIKNVLKEKYSYRQQKKERKEENSMIIYMDKTILNKI